MVLNINKLKPKPKVEQVQRNTTQHTSQQAGKQFQQAMQNARMMQHNPQVQQQSQQHAERQSRHVQHEKKAQPKALQQEEQHEEVRRDDGDTRSSRKNKADSHERVTERSHTGRDGGDQQERGGGEGQQGGQGQPGTGNRERSSRILQEHTKSKVELQAAAASEFQQQLMKAKAQVPGRFSVADMQQLVNKLVQFIKVGKDEVGDACMELGLHEEVFKGLQLRLAEKDGRVRISFQSGDRKVRELFTKERGRLARALRDKGVDADLVIEELV